MQNFSIAQLSDLDSLPCPCGTTRRAFVDEPDATASVHLVDILEDTRPHYHKTITEIYVILQGEGYLELDGESVAVKPLTAVKIKPDCVHRAVGKMRILNIAIPAFDENDEWEVEQARFSSK